KISVSLPLAGGLLAFHLLFLFGGKLPDELTAPPAKPVLAHEDLASEPRTDQADDIVGAHIVGSVALESNAVEADIRPTLRDPQMVAVVGIATAMANQASMGGHPRARELGLLLRSANAPFRMRDNRDAGRLLRERGGG